jgi:hypothetical protein
VESIVEDAEEDSDVIVVEDQCQWDLDLQGVWEAHVIFVVVQLLADVDQEDALEIVVDHAAAEDSDLEDLV